MLPSHVWDHSIGYAKMESYDFVMPSGCTPSGEKPARNVVANLTRGGFKSEVIH